MKQHSQTRTASLVESLVSNAIGFFLTIAAQLLIFPNQKFTENLFFSSVLLVLHIARSYFVRRGFNSYTMKKQREAKEQRKKHKALRRSLKRELKRQDNGPENRSATQ